MTHREYQGAARRTTAGNTLLPVVRWNQATPRLWIPALRPVKLPSITRPFGKASDNPEMRSSRGEATRWQTKGPRGSRRYGGNPSIMRSRGTSNTNARGSSRDRANRRRYLVEAYQSDAGPGTCRCYRCGRVLTSRTLTVDRIRPGCLGGRYVRANIRPACSSCNSATGGRVRRR